MYPITCAGGYPIPIKVGRGLQIVALVVTVDDTTLASRCTFVDDDSFKEVEDTQALKTVIADLKGLANADGVLGFVFPEPIKVRKGITIANGTNMIAGRTFVYIK